MTEREIGAQTASCPNCGTELKALDQADGSVSYETCPNCYGGDATQQAQVPADDRQNASTSQPTVARETGTDVTDTTQE